MPRAKAKRLIKRGIIPYSKGSGATTSRTAKCHHIPNTLGVGLLEK
jgi:hypothetical protein